MKTLGYLLVTIATIIIVAILATAGYVYTNQDKVLSKINFKFGLRDINLSQSEVTIKTTIDNKNYFFIIFSDLYVKLFYNGSQIAHSKEIDTSTHLIPINGTTSFDEDVIIDKGISQLIPAFALGQPINIDYEIDVKIFGFKVNTIKDSFTI